MAGFTLGSPYTPSDADRPKVGNMSNRRPAIYLVPLALLHRRRAGGARLSTIAERLFHALLLVSWDAMAWDDPTRIFGHALCGLRAAVGFGRHKSHQPVRDAFAALCQQEYELPSLTRVGGVVTTPLLKGAGRTRMMPIGASPSR